MYVNRKGYHSINVQLICDASYRIINVVARWPGNTHDNRIFNESIIGQRFANGQLQGILLGDSGYQIQPWLMIPIANPTTEAERNYNRYACLSFFNYSSCLYSWHIWHIMVNGFFNLFSPKFGSSFSYREFVWLGDS